VWAATVPFPLVATGAHTPADVVAGILVAVALAGWAPPATNVRAA
jgi:membrane-associated phospholipid phosphatase